MGIINFFTSFLRKFAKKIDSVANKIDSYYKKAEDKVIKTFEEKDDELNLVSTYTVMRKEARKGGYLFLAEVRVVGIELISQTQLIKYLEKYHKAQWARFEEFLHDTQEFQGEQISREGRFNYGKTTEKKGISFKISRREGRVFMGFEDF